MRVNQLIDMEFDEVSLVDRGANQYARTVISKRDDTEENVEPEIYDEDGYPVDLDDLEVGDVVVTDDGEEFEVVFEDDEEVGKSLQGQAIRVGMAGRAAASQTANAARSAGSAAVARGKHAADPLRFKMAQRASNARVRAKEIADLRGGKPETALQNLAGRVKQSRAGDFVGNAGIGVRDTASAAGRHVANNAAAYGAGAAGVGAGVAGGVAIARRLQRGKGLAGAARRLTTGQKIALGAGGAGALGGGAYLASRDRVQKSFTEEVFEELSKAVTDADHDAIIAKALGEIEVLAEEVELAKAQAEYEQDLRVTSEYIDIAKSYPLGVDPEVLGPVLKRCAESLSHEDQLVLAHALTVGAEAIEKSFDDLGVEGYGSNSDVFAAVESFVDENYIAKSAGDKHSAIVKMFEERPDLYEEYDAERRNLLRNYG